VKDRKRETDCESLTLAGRKESISTQGTGGARKGRKRPLPLHSSSLLLCRMRQTASGRQRRRPDRKLLELPEVPCLLCRTLQTARALKERSRPCRTAPV